MNRESSKGGRRPSWTCRGLLTELTHEKEVCKRWKQGQVMWEGYRDMVQARRHGVNKAKAHLELNLVATKRASTSISAAKGKQEEIRAHC